VVRYGEAGVLALLGAATAAMDWQIAATWSVPSWISLLAGAVVVGAFAGVVFVPAGRSSCSAVAVAVLYGLPVVGGIVRWHLAPSAHTALIGDGAYQMQLSRDVLMRGLDPYGFNYLGTGMERAPWNQPFPNPALHHLDYWPGTVLVPLPLQAAFRLVFGWWDERIWLLIAAAGVWLLLSRIAPGPAGRMGGIAFFLVPGHSLLAVLGDNDLPMVALLLGAVLAIVHRRWLLAAVVIGLAIATKQTALIALPVLLIYALRQGIDPRSLLRATALSAGVVLVLFAPFLLWNAGAFLRDTILFNFGAGADSYPIQGLGLSAILLQTGIIHGAQDAFPFLLIQLPLVVAAWYFAWRWLRRHERAGDALLWLGIAFFVFLFTNRFSQQAYLLLGIELVLAALLLRLHAIGVRPANIELQPAAA
jgi:uncharacterized membrane protein YqjE